MCSPAGVTGGNSNTNKVVLKMRRGSDEAVVEGEMERRNQTLVTEWVSSLLGVLGSGFVVAALIYICFKAALKKINNANPSYLILKPSMCPVILDSVASQGRAVQDLSLVMDSFACCMRNSLSLLC